MAEPDWTATLPVEGETARLLRETDWAATPLGPLGDWSPGLRTAVGIVMRSRFPLMVAWGRELVQVYNDAFLPIVGEKHPQVGARIADTWGEIFDVVGPLLHGVMDTGEPTWSQDQLLLVDRLGFPEDTYFTYCYSAVADEDGRPAGIFCTAMETTAQVLDARRLRLLNGLSHVTEPADALGQLVDGVLAHLAAHPDDVRGAALYLDDGDGLRLAGATPLVVALAPREAADRSGAFDLPRRVPSERLVVTSRTPVPAPASLPEQLAVPSERVALVPFRGSEEGAEGLLAVALSPHRRLDEAYGAFLASLARQVGSAVTAVRARESERRRVEQLAALDRAKRDFLADVSHELRTPLMLVNGPLDEVLGDPALPDAVREQLATARRASARLTRLVDDLMTYSRAEAGALEARTVPVDLDERVRAVTGLFEQTASLAGLVLRVESAPLPRPVQVDPAHLETALVNLLSNAVKFTRQGEVVVGTSAGPDGARVSVQDTGIGIAPDDLDRVFDRFQRARSADAPTVEGTGIGLSLVRSVLALSGGSVHVESRLGAGSTFTVELPWSADRQAVPPQALRPGSLSMAGEAERRPARAVGELPAALSAVLPRVLLADDNADVRSYVSGLLRPYAVVTAVADGRGALEVLESEPVDLLLTDVSMPGLDGLSLLDLVRSDVRRRSLPVVLFSARAGEEATVEALQRGADDYLVKPFSPAELVARVRACIDLSRARRQDALLRGRRGGEPALTPTGTV